MPIYVCPICGRTAELPEGNYYCRVCGPSAVMVKRGEAKRGASPTQIELERAVQLIKRHPAMHAVWSVLELDKTLTSTQKNVLWQDFVAAWNRRGLLTNEEADLAMKARFG